MPSAPASSPVRAPAISVPASSGSWCETPCESSEGQAGPEAANPPPLINSAPPAAARPAPSEEGAWLRAARRTLFPRVPLLGRLPSLERLIELVIEPSEQSSTGSSLACCCSPQHARVAAAVDAAAASSIPATEARLLSVPRPSMRGLRATSSDALPAQLGAFGAVSAKPPVPTSVADTAAADSRQVPNFVQGCKARYACSRAYSAEEMAKVVSQADAMVALRAAASVDVHAATVPQSVGAAAVVAGLGAKSGPAASLPALPRQAPALPSRAPSGDNAVDAAELLLARVVDPFGEDGH